MKRKVIKQGPATLMMSLPSKWVKDNNLKKGDELDITIEENGLFISGRGKRNKQEISVDLTKVEITSLINFILIDLFMKGYKKIRIIYKEFSRKHVVTKNKIIDNLLNIENLVKSFIGFEITEDKPGICVVEEITFLDSSSFENTFRRGFLILLENAEYVQNRAFKYSEKYEDFSISYCLKYYTTGKFFKYAVKLLREAKMPIQEKERYLLLINNLNIMGRAYGVMLDIKPLRQISPTLLTEINSLVREFYNQVFNPDIIKIGKLTESINTVQVKIYKTKGQDILLSIVNILKDSIIFLSLEDLVKVKS